MSAGNSWWIDDQEGDRKYAKIKNSEVYKTENNKTSEVKIII